MHEKKIILLCVIILILNSLFGANLKIDYENKLGDFDFYISDKVNKLTINFQNNQLKEIKTLKFDFNGLSVEKENIFSSHQIKVIDSQLYYIKLGYPNLIFRTILYSLNPKKISLNTIKYKKKNLEVESIYYDIKYNENDEFYYDFSTLKYTEKGFISYLNVKVGDLLFNEELAITNFGIFYSSKLNYKIKKFDIFIIRKNINESYILGCNFNYNKINVKISDNIYPISIYGGRGVKRDFSINSSLELKFSICNIDQLLKIKINNKISYNEFLIKELTLDYNISDIFSINKQLVKLSIDYENNKFSYDIEINDIKFSYKDNQFNIYFSKSFIKKNNIFEINISSLGVLSFSYLIKL